MPYQFVPYNILLLLSALITSALGIYGYRHRAAPGTKAFVFGMFIGTLWSVANAMEISALTLEHKLFWANIQYFAYALAPVTWTVMVLQVSEKAHWVTKKNILLLLIIPAITFSLVWMDQIYGFVRHDIYLDITGLQPVIAKKYSPWFWVHFAQAYFLNFFSLFVLLRTVFLKTTRYRTQSFLLLIGTGMIAVVNLAYIMGIHFIQYDISPLVFSLSGAIIALGIFRFQLFNLVPIARNKVIEAMQNIVIVIDDVDIVVDLNPAAVELFTRNKSQNLVGKPLYQLSEEIAAIVNRKDRLIQQEFQSGCSGLRYEILMSRIMNNKGVLMGNVIVMNDITELRQAQEELNSEQRELAVMTERDRLAKDLHDNLGQIFSFAGIQIQAAQLERSRGNQELADKYIERLKEIIDEAHNEMRDYVHNTYIDEYRKNSIKNLIMKQISIFINNSGYFSRKDIILNLADCEFPVEVKVHMLNIVKEALNNIMKHACATSVKISLDADGTFYELVIEDNGIGFVRDQSYSKGSGSGLCIMDERARLLGGIMKIDSVLGQYTKTIVEFPDHLGG